MSLYDPERDRVRIAGRWLRWSLPWIALPLLLGVFVSANVDLRSLPLFGQERLSAVLFLNGQAYFGHLDDSGESGTLMLRDAYYFASTDGGTGGAAISLVRRGAELHGPADGMRINRDQVLGVERVGLGSAVAQAIQVERELLRVSPGAVSLNPTSIAGAAALAKQRVATEHAIARAWTAAVDQLRKLNDLVLPVTPAEAQTITEKAVADLRTVRRNALVTLGNQLGMSAADADAYMRATDPLLDGQSFSGEAVLLAPDLDGIVIRTTQAYAQVGDAAAKLLTQPKATPAPSASPRP